MRIPQILLGALLLASTSSGEDLIPKATPLPTEPPKDDIFSLINQYASSETDWKNWPLNPTKGEKAILETTALVVKYAYRDLHFTAYVYQLPDGLAGLPWVTYVWVDRGKKFQTNELSPTPLIALAQHSSERWSSLESISAGEWKEIHRAVEHLTELPLTKEKEVQPKRILITQRVHPFLEKLRSEGGAAAIHELAWMDGSPLAIVESQHIEKPVYSAPHP
jgi:hypothetical protein